MMRIPVARSLLVALSLGGCTVAKDADDTAPTGDSAGSESGVDSEGDSAESGPGDETGDSAVALAPALEVLLHNVHMEDRALNFTGQDSRSHLIQDAGYLRGHDILIFTDLYDHYVATGVFGDLGPEYGFRTNVVGDVTSGWATSENFKADATRSGGVAVMSTYDLDDATQHIFATPGCGAYVSANLGFAYVRLDLDGRTAHLIATRLQPDHSSCAEGEASATRLAELVELRAWVDAKEIPVDEELIIAGTMDIDPGTPEYTTMLSTLGVIEPRYAGHDDLFDPSENNLAALATSFTVGVPHHGEYVFLAADHPHPEIWQNVGFDQRAQQWWTLDGFTSAELSDTFPLLALAYADADTPTTSNHTRFYDHVSLRSVGSGGLLTASVDIPDDALSATADTEGPLTWVNLASYDEVDTDQLCLGSGDVRGEAGGWLGHFWNLDDLAQLHPSLQDAATGLGVQVFGGGCLVDGSEVALYYVSSDGVHYGHVTTTEQGANVSFTATEVGDAETFTASMTEPVQEDWSDELVYAP